MRIFFLSKVMGLQTWTAPNRHLAVLYTHPRVLSIILGASRAQVQSDWSWIPVGSRKPKGPTLKSKFLVLKHFYSKLIFAQFESGGFCLFLQYLKGVDSLNGGQIKDLVGHLVDNKCQRCGSVPINYPESDDPGAGILTSNYVSKVDNCDGLCTQNIPIGPEPLPDTGPGDIPFPNKPGNKFCLKMHQKSK